MICGPLLKRAKNPTRHIRTSTYIHGVHRHYSAQPGSFAPPLPHARVPPPTLGRIAMCWPCSTPTPLTRASPASSSGNSGSPASPSAIPELAVVDEHMSCAREHTSHECHGHQQPRDRGVRMGLVRGSVPDGRRRPRGCRWPDRPTGGPWPSACARSGRSRAPWPRPSAVWAGANYAPAQTAVFASLWPPQARAWGVTCSNGQSDSGR